MISKAYAHTAPRKSDWEPLERHSHNVAERAEEFAKWFVEKHQLIAPEVRAMGIMHDMGKCGERFQQRLHDCRIHHVDHWTAGAWMALHALGQQGIASALAIQGHHVGLQSGHPNTINELARNPGATVKEGLQLSDPDFRVVKNNFLSQGVEKPCKLASSICCRDLPYCSWMLDVRMLFSCLVDADFLETEKHFNTVEVRPQRVNPPALDAAKALTVLPRYVRMLGGKSSKNMKFIRKELFNACCRASAQKPGIFTLAAPTGAGKTFSMLAFALHHAKEYKLRRIVVVVPYLTVIEQTAKVYREFFTKIAIPDGYLVEHHSLAGIRTETVTAEGEEDNEDEGQRISRLAAENWDAPVILTTSVQFLESLFSNRPAICRKLHNLARSVILMDEVQTLPLHLSIPTLAVLSHLSEHYGTTLVLATATQPAFQHLDDEVRKNCPSGWNPRSIVPAKTVCRLFAQSSRVRVQWPKDDEKLMWDDLASRLVETPQALCVVNLKRHARVLAEKILAKSDNGGQDAVFHLSTNMCPVHRRKVLDDVRSRLVAKLPCRLIATQCIEAGVDVSFTHVWRSWAPLDSLAQVAGRCNRSGELFPEMGEFRVFNPEEEAYPDPVYGNAARITRAFLKGRDPKSWDLDDPALFEAYYRMLYDLARQHMDAKKAQEIAERIEARDFVGVAQAYRLIESDTVNVLVPYDVEAWKKLCDEVRKNGFSGDWVRRAQLHSVAVFRNRPKMRVQDYVQPVPLTSPRRDGDVPKSAEWFMCYNEKQYNGQFGLHLEGLNSDYYA